MLAHLAVTFRTLVRVTHHPSRSPPHKPSLATEQTIASIYQVVRKPHFLCMHAPPHVFFVTFHVFVCFLNESSFGQ